MKIFIYSLIIVISIFSCKKNENKSIAFVKKNQETYNILGSYYHFDKFINDKGDSLADYYETYIGESKMYRFSEVAGRISPTTYLLVNDSIFFQTKKPSNYGGKIIKSTNDKIIIELDSINKVVYYRVKEKIKLKDLINKKISEEKFSEIFYERMFKQKDKMGYE